MRNRCAPRLEGRFRRLSVTDRVTLQTRDRRIDLHEGWRFRPEMIELADRLQVDFVWVRSDRFRAFASGNAIVINPCATLNQLNDFAHECAHVGFHRRRPLPTHRKEFEAETFSAAYLKSIGHEPDLVQVARGRRYVAWKIQMAVARGAKLIDRDAWDFADHPDGFAELAPWRRKYIQEFRGRTGDVQRGHGYEASMLELSCKAAEHLAKRLEG